MIRHIDRAGAVAPADHRSTVLTPRGTAVLAILRAQGLVRQLDAADREYVAPYVADLLVDLCSESLGCPEHS